MTMKKRKTSTKSNKNPPIRGYLPICITLPPVNIKDKQHSFKSFIYVKEHIKKSNRSSSAEGAGATLFVANAPANGPVRTDLFLRALFEPYGEVKRVTVTQNPKKGGGSSSSSLEHERNEVNTTSAVAGEIFREAALADVYGGGGDTITSSRKRGDGKFAHVVFTSAKELKHALKALQNEMAETEDLFTLTLSDEKMDELKLETAQLDSKEDVGPSEEGDNDDEEVNNANQAASLSGIQAVAEQARRKAYRHMSRQQLMQLCNETMAAFEDQEAEAERRAKLAAEQPDDDGFITVTNGSTPSFGATNDFEEEKHGPHRRKAGKRSRKRKATGADELSDFYRFQLKETRKKEVQDLKARFEEDLKKVKKLKEEKAYRPF